MTDVLRKHVTWNVVAFIVYFGKSIRGKRHEIDGKYFMQGGSLKKTHTMLK